MMTPEISHPDEELTPEQASALHQRFGATYVPYFEAHPEHDWVMVTDKSGEILGGGRYFQAPGVEAYLEMEETVGELVHFFGRPIF